MSVSLEELVEERFPAPKWVTLRELRRQPGFDNPRTIDLAAFAAWESGGGRTIAFEVKRSRNDFLRELADPSKRAWVEEYFTECYFVMPQDLVAPDELPAGWGLFSPTKKGDKLRRVRIAAQAPKHRIDSRIATMVVRACAKQVADLREELGSGHGKGRCVPMSDFNSLVRSSSQLRQKLFDAEDASRVLEAPLRHLQTWALQYGKGLPVTEEETRDLLNLAMKRKLRHNYEALVRARDLLSELMGDGDD